MHFTQEFMHMDWERFVEDVVALQHRACHVVVGHDFRFGYRGQGTAERLAEKCAALGIGCDIIPKVELDGRVVSSTYIRQLIAQGDMAQARRFLGHPHTLSGVVRHGRQLGRTIGIPTINMGLEDGVLSPRFGVYATRVRVAGGVYLGVTNVGIRPTVDRSERPEISVETNILDFEEQVYGDEARVEFYEFLRPEQKFSGVDELRDQIRLNREQTREYFAVLDKS